MVDIQNSLCFNADVFITATNSEYTIASNSVPNHDFNDETAAFTGGQTGASIAETDSFSILTRSPPIAAISTALSQEKTNGIFLNGVRLDIVTASCYRPNSSDAGEDGNNGIGFSYLLKEIGLGDQAFASLVFFNLVGEAGQLIILVFLLPAIYFPGKCFPSWRCAQ